MRLQLLLAATARAVFPCLSTTFRSPPAFRRVSTFPRSAATCKGVCGLWFKMSISCCALNKLFTTVIWLLITAEWRGDSFLNAVKEILWLFHCLKLLMSTAEPVIFSLQRISSDYQQLSDPTVLPYSYYCSHTPQLPDTVVPKLVNTLESSGSF